MTIPTYDRSLAGHFLVFHRADGLHDSIRITSEGVPIQLRSPQRKADLAWQTIRTLPGSDPQIIWEADHEAPFELKRFQR